MHRLHHFFGFPGGLSDQVPSKIFLLFPFKYAHAKRYLSKRLLLHVASNSCLACTACSFQLAALRRLTAPSCMSKHGSRVMEMISLSGRTLWVAIEHLVYTLEPSPKPHQVRDQVTMWLTENFAVLNLGQEITSFGEQSSHPSINPTKMSEMLTRKKVISTTLMSSFLIP
jgi:hypothetical protein